MRSTTSEDSKPLIYAYQPSCNMVTMRAFLLLLMGMVAVGLLVWIYTEQDKVDMCTNQKVVRDPVIRGLVDLLNMSAKAAPPSVNKYDWNYNWDSKAHNENVNGVPARSLILVRHGQYDFNTGKLTELGKQQANATGQRLRDLAMPYSVVIHSPLDRAVETGQLLHRYINYDNNIPIHVDAMLAEGGPIQPKPTITYWSLPDRSYHVDGPRMEAAFRKYFYRPDKTQTRQTFEILVGHGNIFRFFALRALQMPPEGWMRLFIAHASITIIHCNADGTVNMNHLGDSGHLGRGQVTF